MNARRGVIGGIGLTIFVAVILGGSYFIIRKIASNRPAEPIACTKDARVCPDGTVVGRIPPDCQFAACPAD